MRMFPSTVDEEERLGSLFTNPGGVSSLLSSLFDVREPQRLIKIFSVCF